MKYLKLNFNSAKLFYNHRKSKDWVVENNLSFNRVVNKDEKRKQYVEPITSNNISNVLHVLCGKRPKPSLRDSLSTLKKCDDVEKMLDDVIVWHDLMNVEKNVNFFGNKLYPYEYIQTAKSASDTHKTGFVMNHEIFRRYCGEHIDMVYKKMGEYFKVENIKEIPFSKINELINTIDIEERKKIKENDVLGFKKLKIMAIYDYIINTSATSRFTSYTNKKITYLNRNGVDWVSKVNGSIYIPLTEKYKQLLSNGSGIATILDGGVVSIDDVVDEMDIPNEARYAKELSNETYTF